MSSTTRRSFLKALVALAALPVVARALTDGAEGDGKDTVRQASSASVKQTSPDLACGGGGRPAICVDVARSGDCVSYITILRGARVVQSEMIGTALGVDLCARVMDLLREHGDAVVVVDGWGYGAGVVDCLRYQGVLVLEVRNLRPFVGMLRDAPYRFDIRDISMEPGGIAPRGRDVFRGCPERVAWHRPRRSWRDVLRDAFRTEARQ